MGKWLTAMALDNRFVYWSGKKWVSSASKGKKYNTQVEAYAKCPFIPATSYRTKILVISTKCPTHSYKLKKSGNYISEWEV